MPVTSPSNAPEFSVSELSGAIKRRLEDDFGHVRVRGEMGRVTIARSGHVYVDLKDANSVLSAVMWKGVAGNLRFRPEEGMEVIATGKISTFPGSSKYQLIIDRLEPAGVGALLQQLEERKRRLAGEGLFAPERKRALPFLPRVIGVVTSPTGAVIRDILHRLADRFPVHVLVWPVLVQGEKAAAQIAHAIEGFNTLAPQGSVPRPDVLIVARGGGSIEDLWAFNEEIVVRAAASSAIPLISAVGHETDTTLIDYASDQRAPTPTGAAEIAVPVRTALIDASASLGLRLKRGLVRGLEGRRVELRAATGRIPRAETLFLGQRQRLDLIEARFGPSLRTLMTAKSSALISLSARLRPATLGADISRKAVQVASLEARLHAAFARRKARESEVLGQGHQRTVQAAGRLEAAMRRVLAAKAERAEASAKLLNSLSYHGVLARGYAVVKNDKGQLIRSATAVKDDARLSITFSDGTMDARAGAGPRQGSLF
jgi:exodeoxyribonuclease VII large subunit